MKKLLLLIFVLFSALSFAQESWQWISPFPGASPRYSCQSEGVIFYSGFPKIFYKTTDAGNSFISGNPYRKVTNSSSSAYQGIAFADILTGILIDDEGAFRTTDGGKVWNPKKEGYRFYSLAGFADNQVGWLFTNGSVEKTTNAGETWVMQSAAGLFENQIGVLSGLEILDRDRLFVCSEFHYNKGGKVRYSSNGGYSWVDITPMESDSLNQVRYKKIKINPSGTGFVVGEIYFPVQSMHVPVIFKTTNFGSSWEDHSAVPLADQFTPLFIVSKNDNEWLIFGRTSRSDYTSSLVMAKSTDGGNEWSYYLNFLSLRYEYQHISTVEYLSEKDILLISASGSFYRSTDFGETFARLTDEKEIRVTSFSIDKRNSSPDQLAAAVSKGDSLIISRDGGRTWTKKFLPESMGSFTDSYVETADDCIFILLGRHSLYRSSDYGDTWKLILTGYNMHNLAVYDRNHIAYSKYFAYSQMLSYTSNGGESWTSSPLPSYITQLKFAGPFELYGIGRMYDSTLVGIIYHTTDGGFNWRSIDTKREMESVVPVNNNTAIAFSKYELYRTSDKGNTWKQIKVSNDFFTYFDVAAFRDTSRGILKISHNLYETTDAGLNWLASSKSIPVWGGTDKIEYNNKGDLLVFSEGSFLILKSNSLGSANNPNPNPSAVNEFLLEQNYPNPFNPVTTITYNIPEKSRVSLIVYDVLGSEVAVLVNEEKLPGRYKAEFNSSGILSSGIYFYRLHAGNYSMTRKMILLR